MKDTLAGRGLSISQRSVGSRALLVRLGGELTSDSACALSTWVGRICDGNARSIHADVSRLRYIDDPGAWTLALAFQCVRFHGNPVQIYNAPAALRCVLDVVSIENTAGRGEHESLAGEPPRGWLAMDLLICHDDPRLSSMFAIFDQLSSGQGPPADLNDWIDGPKRGQE